MKKLAELVANELSKDLYLLELLQSNLAKVSAVALRLQPIIREQMELPVRSEAIAMAVRRFIDRSKKVQRPKHKFPPHIEMTTRTNIYELAFAKDRLSHDIIRRLQKSTPRMPGDFFNIIEGAYEVVILAQQDRKKDVKKLIARQPIKSELNNAAAVTVNWPATTKDIPGIYYRVTRELALRHLSIQSFHTIGSEMMLIVREDALGMTFQTLRNMLQNLG